MYTQCPECGTVFRVTAAVLRAAQGQVRCGVCDANFDALRFLSDEAQSEPATHAAITHAQADDAPLPVEESAADRGAPPDFEWAAEILPAEPLVLRSSDPPSPLSVTAATRTTPSIDQNLALAAMVTEPAPAPARASVVEENVLEPTEIEDIVLERDGSHGGTDADEIPDSALEFNLAAGDWDRVFVADTAAATITPLDVNLQPADGEALGTSTEASLDPVFAAEAIAREHRISGGSDDPLASTDEFRVLELELTGLPLAATLPPPDFPGFEQLAPSAAPEPIAEPTPAPVEMLSSAPAFVPSLAPPLAAPNLVADDAAAVVDRERDLPRRLPSRRWRIAAAALLALAFALQLIHHFREALASNAVVGASLTALYARLGQPIEPQWDIGAYDVKQWGAASEAAPGALRLRASVVNRANRSQPYPMLRVTLEDRFGGRVARREFMPSEYLPGHETPAQLLAPGARADADLNLADPGSQAVGFELDVCIKRAGALACGIDQRSTDGG